MKLHSKSCFAFVAPRTHCLVSYVFVHNYVALLLLLLGLFPNECARILIRLVWQVHFVAFVANDVWHNLLVLVVGNNFFFSLRFSFFLLLLFQLSLKFVKRAQKIDLAPLAFLRHFFRTSLQQVDGSAFAFCSRVKKIYESKFQVSETYRK